MMRLPEALSLRETAHILGGKLTGEGKMVTSVSVDTRSLERGSLFFALPGARRDGSDYLAEAGRRGCAAAVVSSSFAHKAKGVTYPCVLVDDPLSSLLKFAENHLRRGGRATYVGVTGSSGKTTTKDAIAAILSTQGKTVKTPGNLNSEIGLPLSVLQVDGKTKYGVFEMGVDHEGEMRNELSVMKPHVAVLTTIGTSHLAHFGTRERIAREKGAIFHDGIVAGFMEKGSPFLRQIERERHLLLREFASDELLAIDRGLDGFDITLSGNPFHVRAVGRPFLSDIAAAIQVSRFLGVSDEEIARALDGFKPSRGRGNVIDGKVTIIEDCYNANPDSTAMMIDCVSRLSWKGRKNVVLGTMKDLGRMSGRFHKAVARKIREAGMAGTFLYGSEMKSAYDELRRGGYEGSLSYTNDFDELKERVTSSLVSGDLLLLKGSRAMEMERLIPAIRSVG